MYSSKSANTEASEKRSEQNKIAGKGVWYRFSLGLALTIMLGVIATWLAQLPGLAIMGSLTVALLLGLLWRGTIGIPTSYTTGIRFSAQKLLRYGIILTGVRLNFMLIASSGIKVVILDLVLILFGIFIIPWLGRKLGLNRNLALLLGVGQSICGASAVGTMASVMPDHKEEDSSLAVAICGLVGTIGVLLFTFSRYLIPFSDTFYGLLTGSTLHEIAQVVAIGPGASAQAADLAMITKLVRVMLLAPIAVGAAFFLRMRQIKQSKSEKGQQLGWKNVPIPWFVFGFLAVGTLHSLNLFPENISSIILQISTFLMVVAMAAMGLMVDLKIIRHTGLKAFGVAVLAFGLFVILSSFIIGITYW